MLTSPSTTTRRVIDSISGTSLILSHYAGIAPCLVFECLRITDENEVVSSGILPQLCNIFSASGLANAPYIYSYACIWMLDEAADRHPCRISSADGAVLQQHLVNQRSNQPTAYIWHRSHTQQGKSFESVLIRITMNAVTNLWLLKTSPICGCCGPLLQNWMDTIESCLCRDVQVVRIDGFSRSGHCCVDSFNQGPWGAHTHTFLIHTPSSPLPHHHRCGNHPLW